MKATLSVETPRSEQIARLRVAALHAPSDFEAALFEDLATTLASMDGTESSEERLRWSLVHRRIIVRAHAVLAGVR